MTPSREPQRLHRTRKEGLRVSTQRAHLPQPASREHRVGRALAFDLRAPRPSNSIPDGNRRLGRRLVPQLLPRETGHVDEDIHTVEQGSGDASLVAFDLARSAPAGPHLVTIVPTGAGIHGTQQRDPSRIAERRGYPRDGHVTIFQGLTQSLQRSPAKLGQLIEEQHTVMRERHLARPRITAASGEPRGGNGMVRRPERPPRHKRPVTLAARAVHLGHFYALLYGERRQNSRHAPREHGLARTRWTTHDYVMRSSRGHFEGALGVSLPGYVGEVFRGEAVTPVLGRGFCGRHAQAISKEIHGLLQGPHAEHLDTTDHGGLGSVPLRENELPQALLPGALGHGEGALDAPDSAVERELSDHAGPLK